MPTNPVAPDLDSSAGVWQKWQQQMQGRFPAIIYARGFSSYKKPIVQRFFQGSTVVFDPAEIPVRATLVVWGRREVGTWEQEHCQILRLEDGFIRSVGLGADLIWPLSWAVDRRGIYYDATRTSDLEQILQHHCFDQPLLVRARQLRERLVAAAVTKYNVGKGTWQRPNEFLRTIILVPGQVEDDASLLWGAPAIRTNLALLQAVRSDNPEAYIVYKPHPDVVAGLRDLGDGEQNVKNYCDEHVINIGMGALLPLVDEVHTLTSLTGFEALLRGKKVVCYGQPFYSGWGLTDDRVPLSRRSRCLSLDELVAGALILYPTYISHEKKQFASPEQAIQSLLSWNKDNAVMSLWRQWVRYYLKLERWLEGSGKHVGSLGKAIVNNYMHRNDS